MMTELEKINHELEQEAMLMHHEILRLRSALSIIAEVITNDSKGILDAHIGF